MHISEYDYTFPQEAIAYFPPEKRGTSKLFVILTQTGEIIEDIYEHLDHYLTDKDVLVRNITKVFHARLEATPVFEEEQYNKKTEIFITEPHAQSLEEYAHRQFDVKGKGFRLQFLTPLKKQKVLQVKLFDLGDTYEIVNVTQMGDAYEGIFRKQNGVITADELFTYLAHKGKVPLPPYIKRSTVSDDDERYQTVFAHNTGSVAAPTASLNFTKALEQRLNKQGTTIAEVTLHVGRGTFLPLRNDIIEDNTLHYEPYYVAPESLQILAEAMNNHQRVIAMGTTVVRTLETINEYLCNDSAHEPLIGETNLFIYPPYTFSVVGGLLTNFHFPRSSLITLVDAFLQWKQSKMTWQEIYTYAIERNAKLFSYGDSMLII